MLDRMLTLFPEAQTFVDAASARVASAAKPVARVRRLGPIVMLEVRTHGHNPCIRLLPHTLEAYSVSVQYSGPAVCIWEYLWSTRLLSCAHRGLIRSFCPRASSGMQTWSLRTPSMGMRRRLQRHPCPHSHCQPHQRSQSTWRRLPHSPRSRLHHSRQRPRRLSRLRHLPNRCSRTRLRLRPHHSPLNHPRASTPVARQRLTGCLLCQQARARLGPWAGTVRQWIQQLWRQGTQGWRPTPFLACLGAGACASCQARPWQLRRTRTTWQRRNQMMSRQTRRERRVRQEGAGRARARLTQRPRRRHRHHILPAVGGRLERPECMAVCRAWQ